jgi:hypothetical protein
MEDSKTPAPRPDPETRPRPESLETETRSLSDAVVAAGAISFVTGAGLTAGKLAVEGTVAKAKDALAPKDEGKKLILPGDPED